MHQHEKINYLEFPSKDLVKTKAFFSKTFGWTFEDFGIDYTAFSGEGLDGGFFKSDQVSSTEKGSVLVVFYSSNIHATQKKIESAGGMIVQPIFSFPGGKRFHFADPNGNEYAVWSESDK